MNVSKSQGITSSHDDHGMTNRSKHPPNQPWRERIKVQEQPQGLILIRFIYKSFSFLCFDLQPLYLTNNSGEKFLARG